MTAVVYENLFAAIVAVEPRFFSVDILLQIRILTPWNQHELKIIVLFISSDKHSQGVSFCTQFYLYILF